MRMNQSAPRTAADIIEQYDRQQLIKTLAAFGDLKRPAPIADAIISAREKGPLQTTGQLLEAVARCVNPRQEKKELAQIFQALRIEVNGEMDALEQFLKSTLAALRPGGRLAIITYHSLEDRMVKNFMKSGNIGGEVEKDFFGHVKTPWKQITRSPIVPSEAETARNPRSRSAKLRAAERVQE